MTDPKRLRESEGPAGLLLGGAKALRVPGNARSRALAFTGTAAGLAASKGAAAASATALLKTFALCVCVGAAGGGAMSLVASEMVSHYQPAAKAPVPRLLRPKSNSESPRAAARRITSQYMKSLA